MQTILYIEDDPLDVLVFQREIGKIAPDTVIDFVASGEAALECLSGQDHRWDGLVVDLNMPGMGGLDFIASARAIGRLDRTPIIAFSTSSLSTDKQAAIGRGADDYVVKSDSSASYEALLLKLRAAILERNAT